MRTMTLNTDTRIPAAGFGVYQIPAEQTQASVEAALQAGYRHIDTAAAYGNEAEVGAALRAAGLPREEVYATTKLWIQDASHAETASYEAGRRSLQRLGLDHVDLFLMHQPYGDVYAQWRGLSRLHLEGGATTLGVSNFTPGRTLDLSLNSQIKPAVNQIEINPFFQREAAVRALQEQGVVVEAWAPFAEGRNDLFTNPVLAGIGAEHDASVAQVVLAWLATRNIVGLAKSVRPERIAENLAAAELTLTPANLAAIAVLDTGTSQFFDHDNPVRVSRMSLHRIDA